MAFNRRARALELLAASQLADRDLQLEGMRGQRQAAQAQANANALQAIIQGASALGGKAYDLADKATDKEGLRFGLSLKGETGSMGRPEGPLLEGQTPPPDTYNRSPFEESRARAREAFPELPKTGNPLKDFLGDPFGAQSGLRNWSREKAELAGASEIAAAREARRIEEQKAAEKQLDRDIRERQLEDNALWRQSQVEHDDRQLAALVGHLGNQDKVAEQRASEATRHNIATEAIARDRAARSAAGPGALKPVPHAVAQEATKASDAIAGIANIIQQYDALSAKLGGDVTGPLRAPYEKLRNTVGMGNPELEAFYGDVDKLAAVFGKETFGAAISKYDSDKIASIMAQPTRDDAQFRAKVMQAYRYAIEALIRNYPIMQAQVPGGVLPESMSLENLLRRATPLGFDMPDSQAAAAPRLPAAPRAAPPRSGRSEADKLKDIP